MKIQAGKTLYTIAKDAFTVGSDAACDVVIDDDPAVLPLHLEAKLRGTGRDVELVLALTGDVTVGGTRYTRESTAPVVRWTTFGTATVKLGYSRFRIVELHEPTGWFRGLFAQPGSVTREPAPRRQIPVTKMNPPPPFVVVPPAIPETETEARLLAATFGDPADAASRMVYADWLEQHDEALAARVVRGDAFYEVNTFAWRAMVSRGAITGCGRADCPATWDRCRIVEGDVAVRTCGTCKHSVRYVSTTGYVTSHLNVLDE